MTTQHPSSHHPAPGTLAIEARDLVKTFGTTQALDGFDLSVPAGQVTGFLGPNGSGKSTAIRVFLGMLRADSGSARVLGRDAWSEQVAIHRRLAYVPGDTSLWPNLTGGEAIDILARLGGTGRGRHRAGHRDRRDELLERFELDPSKKARTYSKGNRQKVALVAALASDAELFVFDEPTSGLDPLMEAVFTDEVRALRNAGRTVLLSSHILAEVEKLCDTVTIIRAGRAVESGTLAQMRHLTRSTVSATLEPGPDAGPSGSADQSGWAGLPGVHDLAVDGQRLRFDVDHHHLTDVLGRLAESGVQNLTIAPPSLEDLFLRHYGDRVDAP
ncbi:ABC transporter ATP-binding protein [Citricoccus sp. NPDC079358]|jgi:ABC-2 type transport system ATP-binding protein|uniref:ABC transporter ATP-binding protein n=1 Tax=Citricoccus sp. NPDC079358 TaxID=3154653 RepID=UPI00344B57F3